MLGPIAALHMILYMEGQHFGVIIRISFIQLRNQHDLHAIYTVGVHCQVQHTYQLGPGLAHITAERELIVRLLEIDCLTGTEICDLLKSVQSYVWFALYVLLLRYFQST